MAVRRLAPEAVQPKDFVFTQSMEDWAKAQIAKYPEGRQMSAVVPLLWHVQGECGGWLPKAAIEAVAERLAMPYMRVLEVATFYTMFNLEPVGRYFIQCCGTTPCALRGANDLMAFLGERVGPQKTVSADGNFSWLEVECMGACCNAPMVQINNDYYEDLTPETLGKVMDDLAATNEAKAGSQIGRSGSEPFEAVTTLQDATLFDGSRIGAWRQRFEEEAKAAEAKAAEAKAQAEKTSTDARVAEGDTRPAKPDAGRPIERPVTNAEGQRAASGQEPTRPDARAGASSTDKATVAKNDTREESRPSPQSDKSFVGTPVKPEDDRPVAEAKGDTTKEAGTPPSAEPPRRDGSESKPSTGGTYEKPSETGEK
ncbi:MAG TPA: NADH-quinone oxidoreductase subunit NuoE [Beijerinckiaceae bacterium]